MKNQQINHDLFTASQEASLIAVLVAPDPDIMTTTPAVTVEEQESSEQLAESDDDDTNGDGRV